ncbi:MAG: alpha/beta hydrolase [Sphingopyxis sp.]|nr:alpha/beta hydrolase [Sphingopyxis sp.]
MWVAESRIAQSTKAEIYYEIYGTGPCVVMIPGGFETHVCFYKNIPAFVQAGYTVIATNLRGHFQSPCKTGDLSFRNHPDDIAAVLDQEGIYRAALIGWSMGGFGATRFALHNPDKTSALVLMGSTAGVWSEMNYANNGKAINAVTADIAKGGPWSFDMNQDNASDKFLRRQLQMLHSDDGFLPGPVALLPMMMDKDIWLSPNELTKFNTPSLLVGGDTDNFLPAGFQRHLAEILPGAELSAFQEAGHNPHWEDPVQFNETTISWLKSKGW